MDNLDNTPPEGNQASTEQLSTKQPFATRFIEKFKQKTLLEKIVSVVAIVVLLTTLFTVLMVIMQIAKITSIVKGLISLLSMLFEFITGS